MTFPPLTSPAATSLPTASLRPPLPAGARPGLRTARLFALALLLATVSLCAPLAAAATQAGSGVQLQGEDRAEALLQAEDPEGALGLLDGLLEDDPDRPRALLLRSTAHFMLGDEEAGRADLKRSLGLDPGQRQAWLNRAALDIADGDYPAALQALEEARRLDPGALDNHLNIGAVQLFLGRIEEARASFGRYLEAAGDSAEAHYLVATNYAGRGYGRAAIEALGRAVAIDERIRLQVRTDPNFAPLSGDPQLQQLLSTDRWRPPAGTPVIERTFGGFYDGGQGLLLPAVLDGLRESGEAFDPGVEATRDWALIWGDGLRLKVYDRLEEGKAVGVLEVYGTFDGPSAETGADRFEARTETIYRQVTAHLLQRMKAPSEPVEGP